MPSEFQLSLDDDLLRRVESWRRQNPLVGSVPEALAILVGQGLDTDRNALGAFEKLNLILLAQLCKKAGIDDPIDPTFLHQSVQRGHLWAIEWEYPNLTNSHTNNSAQADFVTRLLTIWRLLMESWEALPPADRARVEAATGLPDGLPFPGFDHGQEINYSSIARFMVEQMKLFPGFREQAIRDSRRPMLAAYRALIRAYDEVRIGATDRLLDAGQLEQVLKSLAPAAA